MSGRPIPWYETLAMLVEVTDGGDIIQPVLPGVVAIVLPQFGGAVYTENAISPGWSEWHPTGDLPEVTYHIEGTAVGPYQYVASGTISASHHGVITTAFYNVNVGYVLRLSVNVFGYQTGSRSQLVRIEGYNATTTTVLASWETVAQSNNIWTTMQVSTTPIPAGVTRIRVMISQEFATFGRHIKMSNPILWHDPNLPGQPALVPLTWRDITCDVQSTTIRYGRNVLTERFDVGAFSLVLVNRDGDYTFSNPHPEQFGPGALVRVSAIHNGITYPMAYGVIDSIVDDTDIEGKSVVVVSAFDPTSLWASINWRTTYGISDGAGELSGARINRLLNYVSYPMRSIDAGTIAVQALPAVSGRPLRDDAGITADTEGGAIFAERNGSIVFRDSTWRANADYAQSVQANLTAQDDDVPHDGFDYLPDNENAPDLCPHELVTDWSLRRLINRVALANAGGTTSTYDRYPSQRAHGVRGYQRLDYIGTTTAWHAARAEALLAQFDTPKLRVNAVTYRPAIGGTDDAWVFTLRVFFNWLVRVWYRNPIDDWGYAVAAYVQGIEHRITPTDWVTTLKLDDPAIFALTTPGRSSVWAIEDGERAIWDESTWDGVNWDIPGERMVALWDEAVWH